MHSHDLVGGDYLPTMVNIFNDSGSSFEFSNLGWVINYPKQVVRETEML